MRADPSGVPLVRRFTVGGWFSVAGAALAVFAVLAMTAGALAISHLSDARGRVVDHLDPGSRAAAELLTGYVDQETGVRGYELSGEDSYLEPYMTGRRDVRTAVATVLRSTRALHDRQIDARVRAALVAGKVWEQTYAVPTVARVRKSGPLSGDVKAGKLEFDELRAQVSRLQDSLTAERLNSKTKLNQAATTLTETFAAVALLLALGGALALLALRATVTKPVERLAHRTRLVAAGEFELAVSADGPRDIAALGTDVESMRERIVHELGVTETARRELELQGRELERSNAELEQFAYVASHDLQEPLRKVTSFTQLLQKRYGGQLDERADEYIGFATDGAKRMQQLINDLLAFSRVGRIPSEATAIVDTNDALEDALQALAEVIAETGGSVEHADLPRVHGERTLLAGVFQNIVSNALKFRSEGVTPRVDITVARAGEMWQFTCKDNGIGVEPEYSERIFLIFQRLHPKDRYAGTGIGLAMCRKIVEYHGGHMWLDTEDTTGSTFHFTLPVLSEDA